MQVYISGGLTNIENLSLRDVYQKLGEQCERAGHTAYVPHLSGTDPIKNPDVSAATVWKNDHRQVASADLVIAYVGVPSLGVGAELEIARVTASDLVIWWFRGDKVSRMALGNPAAKHHIEAENEEDLYKKMETMIRLYQ